MHARCSRAPNIETFIFVPRPRTNHYRSLFFRDSLPAELHLVHSSQQTSPECQLNIAQSACSMVTGARSHGGQKKHIQDNFKVSMKDADIARASGETLSQHRPAWRLATSKGATTHEQHRIETAKTRRTVRNTRASSVFTASGLPATLSSFRSARHLLELTAHARSRKILLM